MKTRGNGKLNICGVGIQKNIDQELIMDNNAGRKYTPVHPKPKPLSRNISLLVVYYLSNIWHNFPAACH